MDESQVAKTLREAQETLLRAFEETGGWGDDLTPTQKRVVSNIQSVRSHTSRALMGLTR